MTHMANFQWMDFSKEIYGKLEVHFLVKRSSQPNRIQKTFMIPSKGCTASFSHYVELCPMELWRKGSQE